MLVSHNDFKGVDLMTSNRILQLNAISTASCAVGMLVTRGTLYTFFGLNAPLLLDVLAVGLLAYAVALGLAAWRQPVTRQALMAFTAADGLWVAASALVLLVFWGQLAPLARILIVAVAVVVEMFATLQFVAARKIDPRSLQTA
jgi:hypothetical protein